jgi:hypothetical protein
MYFDMPRNKIKNCKWYIKNRSILFELHRMVDGEGKYLMLPQIIAPSKLNITMLYGWVLFGLPIEIDSTIKGNITLR